MQIAHAQLTRYKVARYWYIQHDALYGRELADNLLLLVLFSNHLDRKVRLHLAVKSPIHR